MCAFGVLAALMHRQSTGLGQVIDVSMTHGMLLHSVLALPHSPCLHRIQRLAQARPMSAPLSILCAILDFGRFREVEAFLMEVSELTSLGMFTLTRVPPVLRVVRSTVLHHVLVRGWTSGGCRRHRSTGAMVSPSSIIGSCISRLCSSTGHCCKVWDAKSRFRQGIRWIPQRAAVTWSTLFQLRASCSFTREADGIPLAKCLLISLYKRRKKNGARSSMAPTLALPLFCSRISCMSTPCILPGGQHLLNPLQKKSHFDVTEELL